MLRMLHYLFGGDKKGSYPESLIKAAIERAVDGTDPWLRAVSGYKRKLRPAVLRAIDYVVELVDALPPAVPVSLKTFGDDPRLKVFFISTADMGKTFGGDRNLADFLKGPGGALPQVVALLGMEKREKMIFGAALSGDIVIHDVAQVTVSFEAHRLIDPSDNEVEARRHLKRRAYDHLLGMALRRIAFVKTEREDLERRRTILHSKLELLERGDWGFSQSGTTEKLDVEWVEEQLGQIEKHLLDLGGDDRMFEAYLEIVIEVLGRPEEYLGFRKETMCIDRMGIKRSQPADDAPELTLHELYNAEGHSLVVSLITLSVDEMQGLAR